MKTFMFSLDTALKSLWQEKWINFLTILSVATGLLILSIFSVISLNADAVVKRWASEFGMIIYLDDSADRTTEERLQREFTNDPDIAQVKFISKNEAMKDLQNTLGENSSILEHVDENPLPASFEISFKNKNLDSLYVKKKTALIEKMSGVTDIQYAEKWLSSLSIVSALLKAGVIILGSAIVIAIVFITYNTIKIFFYRRRSEIETLKLLGATRTFIRLPFLLEAIFIGMAAGLLSAAALFGIHFFVTNKLPNFLPAVSMLKIILPAVVYLILPLAGAAVSFTGSFIAVGKIRY
ncbi:MAG: ABC transporter permease [Nitrospira sp.]|nr:ABC transporter permease [bacterium]MBL7049949.1 ABC transporter permease [Nitrospira sp.]